MKMKRKLIHVGASCLGALSLVGAVLALNACSEDPEDTQAPAQPAVVPADGTSTAIAQLPFLDSTTNTQVVAELLGKTTALGETTALHVRLPPTQNRELATSFVRVIGETSNPQVVFRSDALAQMGIISKSPGPDFFTAFATLSPTELDKIKQNQAQIASGVFGQTTTESVVFNSRAAVARTINPAISGDIFRQIGNPVPINRCAIRPVSTLQAWGQSLFITSPSVVLDPARTWDPCTGAGTQGGVWTFAHFIREMAIGSGSTPEDFVKNWLSLWLNNYTVNGDVVAARTTMFNQVIQPWATASGVTATLVTNPLTGVKSVTLTGPLNLNIAPYRLEAIVNRIDLGTTVNGGGGYGGGTTSRPVTAGELRFIFGVVQPSPWGAGTEASCGRKRFTTIFEYGVPGTGCQAVVNWAQKWTSLQAFPGFTPAYLAQLQTMTESVVLNGAAPLKGNKNAINQIRTNEVVLGAPWELREFTLTDEQPANPPASQDLPANGPLRKHTVALTPNDGVFSNLGADPTINSFVTTVVMPGTPATTTVPLNCNSTYTMDYIFGGMAFRGGNSLSGPPTGFDFWKANSVPATPVGICARHQFSLNTCNGCHRADSGTNGLGGSTTFTHIDPLSSIPVTLSKFLTGGGPGLTFNVADTQFPATIWPFADLEHRFQRLFDLSHCTSCITIRPMIATFINQLQQLGPVPVDGNPADQPTLRIGPITDLATVQKVMDLRATNAGAARSEPADFIRTVESFSH
jgi:hypothetical protein